MADAGCLGVLVRDDLVSRSRRRSFVHFSPIFGPYILVIKSVSNNPASALILFPTTPPPVPC